MLVKMLDTMPLTTMEEFFFWEDRPAYPCDCFVRLKFSGQLDKSVCEAALCMVLPRHPMFSAKVAEHGRRLRWVFYDDIQPRIHWETVDSLDAMPTASYLDLREDIGIRFHGRISGSASDLTIQVHHSCADGIGICSFIADFLIGYAMLKGDFPVENGLSPLEPQKLPDRGKFGLTVGKFLRMVPKQMVGLLGVRQFLMRKPVPIIPHKAANDNLPVPACYPAIVHRVLEQTQTKKLRDTARRLRVTTNDILATQFFLALASWRAKNGFDNRQWLRMMIPVNMRSRQDATLPAANVVSSVFLDRRGADFDDPDRLLQSINAEMDLIKRLHLGYTFIFSTAICRRLPGGLKKRIRADKCGISCVLTNIGAPFARLPLPTQNGSIIAGDIVLYDIDFIAPIRPYACATMVAAIYAGKLNITLQYDSWSMNESQAVEIIDDFTGRVHSFCERQLHTSEIK